MQSGDDLFIFETPLRKGMRVLAVCKVDFTTPVRVYKQGISMYSEAPAFRTRTKWLARQCGFDTWGLFLKAYPYKLGEEVTLIVLKR